MEIFDANELEIVRTNEEPLSKSTSGMPPVSIVPATKGFKLPPEHKKPLLQFAHGYYTHLVPRTVTKSDGTQQIYWVNPDPDAPKKLTLVSVHTDGDRADHLSHIKAKFGIEEKDLTDLHEGDKVRVLKHKDPAMAGTEAIIGSNSTGKTTPLVCLYMPSKAKTGKWTKESANVNHIELVHRATPETQEVIAPKTVKTYNKATGKVNYVTKAEYERSKGTKKGGMTPGMRAASARNTAFAGGIYEGGGRRFQILKLEDGRAVAHVLNGAPDDKLKIVFKTADLEKLLRAGKYTREYPQSPSDPEKFPMTYAFESGEFHRKGDLTYDDDGEPVVTKKGADDISNVFAEHFDYANSIAMNAALNFPDVNAMDAENIVTDLYPIFLNRLQRYDSWSGNLSGGIKAFITKDVSGYARDWLKARQAENQNMIAQTSLGDDIFESLKEEDVAELGQSSFQQALDRMELEEGLKKERDYLVETFFPKHSYQAEVVGGWLGIGVERAVYGSKVEAAKVLSGKVFSKLKTLPDGSPAPVRESYIVDWLDRRHREIHSVLSREWDDRSSIADLFRRNLVLKNKLLNKREYSAQDYSVAKVTLPAKDTSAGKKFRERLESALSVNGIAPKDVSKMAETVIGIANGQIGPASFSKVVPKRYAAGVDKALDALKISIYRTDKFTGEEHKVNLLEVMKNEAIIKREKEAVSTEASLHHPFRMDAVKKSLGSPIAIVDNYKIYPLSVSDTKGEQ